MLFPTLSVLTLLVASVVASPTPVLDAQAANPTIYMRIEGPTKTIYEKTIVASPKASLTIDGHTARCDGTPKTASGVTNLAALQQTGQYFETMWNGTTFGAITKINGTSNHYDQHLRWASIFNYGENGQDMQGYDESTFEVYCSETIPNLQHFLFAYCGDIDGTSFLIMSGPKTAKVGETVKYKVPYAPGGTYVNDLSVDTTSGQRIYAEFGPGKNGRNSKDATVSVKFTKAGTYNMKAHCPSGVGCVRSNHVVTVVS